MAIKSSNKLFSSSISDLDNYNYLSFFEKFSPKIENEEEIEEKEKPKVDSKKTEQILLSNPYTQLSSYTRGLSNDFLGLLEQIKSHPDIAGMFQITSGYRPGSRTKSGNVSWHASGNALDIIPTKGYTFDQLRQALIQYPDVVQYMQSKGIGILDETSPEMMIKTGATGKHFHIGKDKSAIQGLQVILNKYGIQV